MKYIEINYWVSLGNGDTGDNSGEFTISDGDYNILVDYVVNYAKRRFSDQDVEDVRSGECDEESFYIKVENALSDQNWPYGEREVIKRRLDVQIFKYEQKLIMEDQFVSAKAASKQMSEWGDFMYFLPQKIADAAFEIYKSSL